MRKKEPVSLPPTISVVVLTLNEEATISSCLESITNQHFPKSKFETVIVDGGSEDRTREIAGHYTSKIIVESRHTFGHARNLGVQSARGKYAAFISADAWAEPDWLTNICKAFSSQETAGVVGRQVPITSPGWVSKIRSIGFKRTYSGEAKPMRMGDNFSTVNSAYAKNAILSSGGFDEAIPACEDQDQAHRILQSGFRIIYDPSVIVHHVAEDSLQEIIKKTFRQGIGEGICSSRYQVWSGRLYLSIILLLTLMSLPLALTAGSLRSVAGIMFGSLITLLLLSMTCLAARAFQETRDWRTFLGSYLYYPSVAIAELLGFLLGRLTAHKFPSVRAPRT